MPIIVKTKTHPELWQEWSSLEKGVPKQRGDESSDAAMM